MIVLGFDPFAERVARVLATEATSQQPELPVLVFEPAGDDPVTELRAFVAELIDSAQAHGESFEPRLGCLVCAAAPEAIGSLAALRDTCTMLQSLVAGNQAVSLVVLLPPASADDAAKASAFRFFGALEDVVGELPFLDTVFVNQLVGGSERLAEDGVGEELKTLLAYQLLDPELRPVIASLGQTTVNWRMRVAGRKACYSTLGCYRLEYVPAEALAILSHRLQRDLLDRGLIPEEPLDKRVRAAVQACADELTRERLAALIEHFRQSLLLPGGGSAAAADAASTECTLPATPLVAEATVKALVPRFHSLVDLIDGWTRRALLDFLPSARSYLATARIFVDALRGQRAAAGEGSASGVEWILQKLHAEPPDRSPTGALRELFDCLGCASSLPGQLPESVGFAALLQTVEGLAQEAEAPAAPVAPLRLLAGLLRQLRDWSAPGGAETTAGGSLVVDIGRIYLSEVVPLRNRLSANEAESREVEQEFGRMESRYSGLLRRLLKASAYRAEFERLAARRAELASERESLQRQRAQMSSLTQILLQKVVPSLLRRDSDSLLRRDAEQASDELRTFVASLHGGVAGGDADGKSARGGQRTNTGMMLLDSRHLEALYRKTLERRRLVFPGAVEDMLAFVPPEDDSSAEQGSSYRDCRGLRDHYLRGARSLLDRMADYAHDASSWVLALDALQVIECEGDELAKAFLAEAIDRSRRFLQLSPGMRPRAEAEGRLRGLVIVRTAKPVAKSLAEHYRPLSGSEILDIDTRNRCVIEFITLTVGFPAFLIHALHEGRRLALAENGDPRADLWPRE
ncbi:hypothetical protein [Accumulibacter sp.]|uniref:hypothetical protein n=1 Tax=Accumulibacter sp. TaxID=2053492 RepID=UPI0025EFA5D0|nr:hypothetical protein [Accumulibacter sp.]MCM8595565.1 hypothetical protein [Accumulibacter sp.]MCM8625064.1 hypothetical protein [Accumulibacter sp.]MDS4049713.1 hypothetical protein [Accumulibacter sp.]